MVGEKPGHRRALPPPQPDPSLLAALPGPARVPLAEGVARGRARVRGAPFRPDPRLHPLRRRDRRPRDRDRGGALVHALVPARGRTRARAGHRLSRGGPPAVVAAVTAPHGSPSPVRVRLEANPVSPVGSAALLIENPDARPVAGRVVVVLAGGLVTDPETLPARVAANGQTTVPLVLENRAALPPGRYPAYALFEYTVSGEHHAAVARADVAVVADAGGRRARPLLVGVSALAVTLALLAVAWRRAAARS